MNNFWDNRRGDVTEAQDYLRATDSVSRPVALLLSLVGFLAVFAIVFSMFLGGRWLFNQLDNENSTTETEQVAVIEGEQSTEGQSSPLVDNTAIIEENLDAISERLQNGPPATVDGESSTVDSEGSTTTANPEATTTSPEVSTTIVAGEATVPDVEQLPRTGPGSTLASFVAIAFVGALAHNKLVATRR